MISLIYGPKGTGKTKKIIDSANAAVNTVKGSVVYITDKAKHSKELNYSIRFIDNSEYDIASEAGFKGFIKGILASDSDIENVYIDGLTRMTTTSLENLEPVYLELEKLAEKEDVNFCITVSCEHLPEFLKKYI